MPSKGKARRRRAANAVESAQGLLKKGKVRFGPSAPCARAPMHPSLALGVARRMCGLGLASTSSVQEHLLRVHNIDARQRHSGACGRCSKRRELSVL